MDLASFFSKCEKALVSSLTEKGHPFRYPVLATTAKNHTPNMRTVVLRAYDAAEKTFCIYTDARSQKVEELDHNPSAKILFYDPQQLLQLVVSVRLISKIADSDFYAQLPEKLKKDYATVRAPGTPLEVADTIEYDFDSGHFVKLIFEAEHFECLKLQRPHHRKGQFSKVHQKWEGRWLIP